MSEAVLPRGWASTTLREIAEIVGGVTKDAKKNRGHGFREVPYLRVANVQRGRLDLAEVKFIAASDTDIQNLQLRPGDLLLNEGGDRDKLGRGWIWQGQIPVCIHQNHVFRARLRDECIDPVYVAHYTNSEGQSYFFEHGSQTTNLASISMTKLGSLPILLPPPKEQDRIVAALDERLSELDASVANLERAERNLVRYRASVLAAACSGKLVPTEADLARRDGRTYEPADQLLARILDERRKANTKAKYEEPAKPDTSTLPKLPEGWAWAVLPMLGELNRGKSKHRPRDDKKLYGGKHPFIQTGDVRHSRGSITRWTQTYSDLGLAQSRLWPIGTLCITIAANIADTGILRMAACFPDSVVGFLPEAGISTDYIQYFVMTAKERIERYAPATAQKNINLDILEKVAVPLPPMAEQERIVAEVDRHLSRADALAAAIVQAKRRAQRLRRSILAAAFQGRLVPQDSNDEPASVLLDRIRAQVAAAEQAVRSNKRGRRPKACKMSAVSTTSVPSVAKRRGRPPGSKNKPIHKVATLKRRGRPPGSKNKATAKITVPKRRGRPPGSKNRRN